MLNSLPMVNESVVVQRGDKLVGLIHPDYDAAKQMGFNDDDIASIMEQNRQSLNETMPHYSKISSIEIYKDEFEKTPKKSIKRFLYS